ncbi:hypothetical protein M9H77_04858 [Catharanthus roseus]|uniref:Uncharacterized protein n=2 Tax=Catharanthus roseus TaxID=4058 RepID=A0ACC0CFC8_CATRO|nr:NRT1/PTR family protein 2.7 [Catharanthus roseus]KAI5683630.1 hypothetical protein M9H77_04858 [Catharanthus roseus]
MEKKETMDTKPKEEEEEEPQINYRGIKAMPYIIGNETFEKLGAIGTLSNLLVYLTSVFNMKRITAATLLNVFNGTTNFATLIGAFLCDTYFGRYKTLGFASIASFLGLFMITLTAAIKKLHPPHCGVQEIQCEGPKTGQMAFLLSGFALMIIGAGGIRPCNLAFGADQFNPNTESGKRGINSFFNWYFFTITFAQMVSVTLVVYVQSEVNWGIGLAIPAMFMLISCFIFFFGTKIYVIIKPEGSPLASIAQVVVVSVKKRRLKLPEQPWLSLFNYTPPKSINSKLPYTQQLRFLDKAAIITAEDEIKADGSAANPWGLCSMQQVEEAKCVFRVIPIWAAAIIYHIGTTQQQQYVVFQAQQSNRHLIGTKNFQIPAATYTIFSMLSLTLFVPVYDRVLVPSLRKITRKEGGITLLQRLGIGLFLIVPASLISAFVEDRRRNLALTKPMPGIHSPRGAISSMSALWMVPQLTLTGLSEAFASIGQIEFYYKQFPENMRSFAGSLLFLGMAVSSYLNSFLISIVHHTTEGSSSGNWLPEDLNKGRLDYFYFLVTALVFLNVCYFVVCANWYRYKGEGVTSHLVEMETKKPEKAIV